MDNLLQFSNSIIGIDIITACRRIKLSSIPSSVLFANKYLLLIIINDLRLLLLYGPFGDSRLRTEALERTRET
jgi:hypothetical protein